MKRWQVDIVAGWLSMVGIIIGNLAAILFDPTATTDQSYLLTIFYIGNTCCALSCLYFLHRRVINTIGLLGAWFFAASWVFSTAKELLHVGYDRSVLQLLAYFLMLGIITIYVTNRKDD